MTHAWMFSGDRKEAFKNYTLCSMKANEQKNKCEEKLLLQEAYFHLEPVTAFLKFIRTDWSLPGRMLHYLCSRADSPQGILYHVPAKLTPQNNKWQGKEEDRCRNSQQIRWRQTFTRRWKKSWWALTRRKKKKGSILHSSVWSLRTVLCYFTSYIRTEEYLIMISRLGIFIPYLNFLTGLEI